MERRNTPLYQRILSEDNHQNIQKCCGPHAAKRRRLQETPGPPSISGRSNEIHRFRTGYSPDVLEARLANVQRFSSCAVHGSDPGSSRIRVGGDRTVTFLHECEEREYEAFEDLASTPDGTETSRSETSRSETSINNAGNQEFLSGSQSSQSRESLSVGLRGINTQANPLSPNTCSLILEADKEVESRDSEDDLILEVREASHEKGEEDSANASEVSEETSRSDISELDNDIASDGSSGDISFSVSDDDSSKFSSPRAVTEKSSSDSSDHVVFVHPQRRRHRRSSGDAVVSFFMPNSRRIWDVDTSETSQSSLDSSTDHRRYLSGSDESNLSSDVTGSSSNDSENSSDTDDSYGLSNLSQGSDLDRIEAAANSVPSSSYSHSVLPSSAITDPPISRLGSRRPQAKSKAERKPSWLTRPLYSEEDIHPKTFRTMDTAFSAITTTSRTENNTPSVDMSEASEEELMRDLMSDGDDEIVRHHKNSPAQFQAGLLRGKKKEKNKLDTDVSFPAGNLKYVENTPGAPRTVQDLRTVLMNPNSRQVPVQPKIDLRIPGNDRVQRLDHPDSRILILSDPQWNSTKQRPDNVIGPTRIKGPSGEARIGEFMPFLGAPELIDIIRGVSDSTSNSESSTDNWVASATLDKIRGKSVEVPHGARSRSNQLHVDSKSEENFSRSMNSESGNTKFPRRNQQKKTKKQSSQLGHLTLDSSISVKGVAYGTDRIPIPRLALTYGTGRPAGSFSGESVCSFAPQAPEWDNWLKQQEGEREKGPINFHLDARYSGQDPFADLLEYRVDDIDQKNDRVIGGFSRDADGETRFWAEIADEANIRRKRKARMRAEGAETVETRSNRQIMESLDAQYTSVSTVSQSASSRAKFADGDDVNQSRRNSRMKSALSFTKKRLEEMKSRSFEQINRMPSLPGGIKLLSKQTGLRSSNGELESQRLTQSFVKDLDADLRAVEREFSASGNNGFKRRRHSTLISDSKILPNPYAMPDLESVPRKRPEKVKRPAFLRRSSERFLLNNDDQEIWRPTNGCSDGRGSFRQERSLTTQGGQSRRSTSTIWSEADPSRDPELKQGKSENLRLKSNRESVENSQQNESSGKTEQVEVEDQANQFSLASSGPKRVDNWLRPKDIGAASRLSNLTLRVKLSTYSLKRLLFSPDGEVKDLVRRLEDLSVEENLIRPYFREAWVEGEVTPDTSRLPVSFKTHKHNKETPNFGSESFSFGSTLSSESTRHSLSSAEVIFLPKSESDSDSSVVKAGKRKRTDIPQLQITAPTADDGGIIKAQTVRDFVGDKVKSIAVKCRETLMLSSTHISSRPKSGYKSANGLSSEVEKPSEATSNVLSGGTGSHSLGESRKRRLSDMKRRTSFLAFKEKAKSNIGFARARSPAKAGTGTPSNFDDTFKKGPFHRSSAINRDHLFSEDVGDLLIPREFDKLLIDQKVRPSSIAGGSDEFWDTGVGPKPDLEAGPARIVVRKNNALMRRSALRADEGNKSQGKAHIDSNDELEATTLKTQDTGLLKRVRKYEELPSILDLRSYFPDVCTSTLACCTAILSIVQIGGFFNLVMRWGGGVVLIPYALSTFAIVLPLVELEIALGNLTRGSCPKGVDRCWPLAKLFGVVCVGIWFISVLSSVAECGKIVLLLFEFFKSVPGWLPPESALTLCESTIPQPDVCNSSKECLYANGVCISDPLYWAGLYGDTLSAPHDGYRTAANYAVWVVVGLMSLMPFQHVGMLAFSSAFLFALVAVIVFASNSLVTGAGAAAMEYMFANYDYSKLRLPGIWLDCLRHAIVSVCIGKGVMSMIGSTTRVGVNVVQVAVTSVATNAFCTVMITAAASMFVDTLASTVGQTVPQLASRLPRLFLTIIPAFAGTSFAHKFAAGVFVAAAFLTHLFSILFNANVLSTFFEESKLAFTDYAGRKFSVLLVFALGAPFLLLDYRVPYLDGIAEVVIVWVTIVLLVELIAVGWQKNLSIQYKAVGRRAVHLFTTTFWGCIFLGGLTFDFVVFYKRTCDKNDTSEGCFTHHSEMMTVASFSFLFCFGFLGSILLGWGYCRTALLHQSVAQTVRTQQLGSTIDLLGTVSQPVMSEIEDAIPSSGHTSKKKVSSTSSSSQSRVRQFYPRSSLKTHSHSHRLRTRHRVTIHVPKGEEKQGTEKCAEGVSKAQNMKVPEATPQGIARAPSSMGRSARPDSYVTENTVIVPTTGALFMLKDTIWWLSVANVEFTRTVFNGIMSGNSFMRMSFYFTVMTKYFIPPLLLTICFDSIGRITNADINVLPAQPVYQLLIARINIGLWICTVVTFMTAAIPFFISLYHPGAGQVMLPPPCHYMLLEFLPRFPLSRTSAFSSRYLSKFFFGHLHKYEAEYPRGQIDVATDAGEDVGEESSALLTESSLDDGRDYIWDMPFVPRPADEIPPHTHVLNLGPALGGIVLGKYPTT